MKTDFDRVFTEQYDRLVARTHRLLPRGLGDAEEYVHLAYVRCRSTWSTHRNSSHDQAAYFLRSIRWLVVDALRRRRRESALLHGAAETRPRTTSADFARTDALDELQCLPRRQRQLGKALLAGKSAEQIERRFGLSKAARAVGVSRLRQAWIKRLIRTS